MKADLPAILIFLMFTRMPGVFLISSAHFSYSYHLRVISENCCSCMVPVHSFPRYKGCLAQVKKRAMVLCSGPVAKTPLAKYAESLATSESDGDSRRDTVVPRGAQVPVLHLPSDFYVETGDVSAGILCYYDLCIELSRHK